VESEREQRGGVEAAAGLMNSAMPSFFLLLYWPLLDTGSLSFQHNRGYS
jgi:hypothetical protein